MQRPTFCRIRFDQAQQLAPTRSDEEHVGHTASLLLAEPPHVSRDLKWLHRSHGMVLQTFFGLGHIMVSSPALFPSTAALLRASRGDKDFPVLLQLFDLGVGALIKTQRLPQMLRTCHGLGKRSWREPNPSIVTQSSSPGVSPHVALLKNQLIFEDALGSQRDTQQQQSSEAFIIPQVFEDGSVCASMAPACGGHLGTSQWHVKHMVWGKWGALFNVCLVFTQ